MMLAIVCSATLVHAHDPVSDNQLTANHKAGGWQLLFNGKDLTGWVGRSADGKAGGWTVGAPKLDPSDHHRLIAEPGGDDLINICKQHGESVDLYTKQKFRDVTIELEVMVPEGSNSGVYLMGEYEVQVLDSYGKDNNPANSDMGAIYGIKAPDHPHYRKPGQWQTLKIKFIAPRFDAAGHKTADARFATVELNGNVVQKDLDVPHPTGGELSKEEVPTGPLMLQGNHGEVAYRNIKVTPND
jgi:hypothetical protein